MYKWKPTSRNIWLFYNRKVSCIVPYTLFFQPKSNQMLGLWIICGNKILPHFYSGHVYDYWGSKTADPCVIWVVGVYTYRVASYKCFFGMQIFHHIKCSPLEFKISILSCVWWNSSNSIYILHIVVKVNACVTVQSLLKNDQMSLHTYLEYTRGVAYRW